MPCITLSTRRAPARAALFAALVAALLAAPAVRAADDPEPAAPPSRASGDLASARALIEKKDWSGAVAALERARHQDRRNADVHNLLGYSLRHLGRLDAAFESYEQALLINPRHLGAHEYIGEAYLLARKPDMARRHLNELRALCGETCEQTQDLAKAIAAYKP
jgi:tetratricopeptide (TPR) repeat protein